MTRISFMSFPGEIRNKIYELAVPMNQAIKLWPDDYAWIHRLPQREDKLGSYRHIILKQLKLLRLSKQINKEITEMFYRDNEFRFSGKDGWQVLAAFLLAIGPTNARYLTKASLETYITI